MAAEFKSQVIKPSSVYNYKGSEFVGVSTDLVFSDKFGVWRCRCGAGRMRYKIDPGIYAVGKPTEDSPVLVSANYKMSFDRLRKELTVLDAWIMVIDTSGINVWCAAGKGTFGTDEIVRCVEEFKLSEIVSHRELVVPQLGAPSVSAKNVKERSGFRVIYGPVRAADIPAFLAAGMKATDRMRRIRFPLFDRVVLAPIELVMWGKFAIIAFIFFLLLGGFSRQGFSIRQMMDTGLPSAMIFAFAYIGGGVLGPALLPFLPGRAFSLKGLWIGVFLFALMAIFQPSLLTPSGSRFFVIAWILIIPVVTSFIVMNFTGASTYTSLSGVQREMKLALPLQIVGAIAGTGLWVTALFV